MNASTNVAFFLAAWAVWELARRSGARSGGVLVLTALIVTIGIGSGLFHTFATPWARALDLLPILVFQLCYLWLYGRDIITLGPDRPERSWRRSWSRPTSGDSSLTSSTAR